LSPPLQVVVALPKVTAAIIPTSSGGAPQLVDARSDSRTGDLDEAFQVLVLLGTQSYVALCLYTIAIWQKQLQLPLPQESSISTRLSLQLHLVYSLE
jgi:hypothetical protein